MLRVAHCSLASSPIVAWRCVGQEVKDVDLNYHIQETKLPEPADKVCCAFQKCGLCS